MSENKQNKFLNFLKANIYYILVILALAVMIVVIALTNTTSDVENVSTQAVEEVQDQTDVKDVNAPVVPTYVSPLANFTILKEYNDTELMFNASLNRWEAHKSMDLGASDGEKVLSVASGEVSEVYNNYLEGNVVVIKHANGMQSVYGSLGDNVLVKVGDKVSAGQTIGTVSTSAKGEYINQSHLHFELLRNGLQIDPVTYIPLSDK